MGLFNFSKYNDTEKELLDLYTIEFQKIKIPEPSKMAGNLLDEAIKESKKINISPNAGDLILEKEKNDENTRRVLEKKRREGMRDEDIRWWWNLNGVERMMMLKVDEFYRMALHIKCREEDGMSVEQAAEQIRRSHPIFGNPEDATHTQGDDRPIPEELKGRINIYIEKRMKSDPEKFKAEIKQSTTFNALIRKAICAGKL